MAQILVANNCAVLRGEIIAIRDDDHVWTKHETLQAWLTAGEPVETWPRHFSLVIVTDKTAAELAHLTALHLVEVNGELQATGNAAYFTEPAAETALYQALLNDGQVAVPYSMAEQYLAWRQ